MGSNGRSFKPSPLSFVVGKPGLARPRLAETNLPCGRFLSCRGRKVRADEGVRPEREGGCAP
jgi:hypothetical protein